MQPNPDRPWRLLSSVASRELLTVQWSFVMTITKQVLLSNFHLTTVFPPCLRTGRSLRRAGRYLDTTGGFGVGRPMVSWDLAFALTLQW